LSICSIKLNRQAEIILSFSFVFVINFFISAQWMPTLTIFKKIKKLKKLFKKIKQFWCSYLLVHLWPQQIFKKSQVNWLMLPDHSWVWLQILVQKKWKVKLNFSFSEYCLKLLNLEKSSKKLNTYRFFFHQQLFFHHIHFQHESLVLMATQKHINIINIIRLLCSLQHLLNCSLILNNDQSTMKKLNKKSSQNFVCIFDQNSLKKLMKWIHWDKFLENSS